jgi:hypothetical protein
VRASWATRQSLDNCLIVLGTNQQRRTRVRTQDVVAQCLLASPCSQNIMAHLVEFDFLLSKLSEPKIKTADITHAAASAAPAASFSRATRKSFK